MPGETKYKRRHLLRRKEIDELAQRITATFGCEVLTGTDNVEVAEVAGEHGQEFVLVDGVPVAIFIDGVPTLTVRGLLKFKATKAYVEVDMGAVPFVTKGADVMCPGIVTADPAIEVGGLVWVRDTKNKKPLAIGRALVKGTEMVRTNKGKAVKTLHYVGDELWQVGS
jgi:PUA domain protein